MLRLSETKLREARAKGQIFGGGKICPFASKNTEKSKDVRGREIFNKFCC